MHTSWHSKWCSCIFQLSPQFTCCVTCVVFWTCQYFAGVGEAVRCELEIVLSFLAYNHRILPIWPLLIYKYCPTMDFNQKLLPYGGDFHHTSLLWVGIFTIHHCPGWGFSPYITAVGGDFHHASLSWMGIFNIHHCLGGDFHNTSLLGLGVAEDTYFAICNTYLPFEELW